MAPIAEAYVRVRADKTTFNRDIATLDRTPGAETSGQTLGQRVARGMGKPVRDEHGRLVKAAGDAPGAEGAGTKLGSRVGRGLRSTFGTMVGGLAGTFAAVGAVRVFSGFIADARESARVGRLTEAVIRSTGGAARLTAAQVGELATAISNKTGADDEAIQAGQNLLLTFTNVRNEAGRGNDIFNQASQALVDMTAAMNNGQVTSEGMRSSSIQLGKALNDPIKGVSALSRVGVSFTEQQKKQIETLVESGDVMGAQKIILQELGKEFGGAAAAGADPMSRLSVIVGNLGEKIGGALLPHIDTLATFVGDRVVPAVERFIDGMQSGTGAGGAFASILGTARDVLGTLAGIISDVAGFLSRHTTAVKIAAAAIGIFVAALIAANAAMAAQRGAAAVTTAWRVITAASLTAEARQKASATSMAARWAWLGAQATAHAVKTAAAWALSAGASAATALASMVATSAKFVARWVFMGAQALLHAAKVAAAWVIAMGPVGIAIAAVAGLVAVIITNWDTIKRVTAAVWDWVVAKIRAAWDGIKAVVGAVLGVIRAVITGYFNAYKAVITGIWNAIKAVTATVWNAIKALVTGAVNGLKAAINRIGEIVAAVRGFFSRAKDAAAEKLSALVGFVKGIPGRILSALGNVGRMLYDAGRRIIQGLIDGIKAMVGKVGDAIGGVAKKVRDFLPFSPAKEGPLAGAGSPEKAGATIAEMVAAGLASRLPAITAAVRAVTASLAAPRLTAATGPPPPEGAPATRRPPGLPGAAAPAAGQSLPRLHPADIRALAAEIGQVVAAAVGAGNYAAARAAGLYARGG